MTKQVVTKQERLRKLMRKPNSLATQAMALAADEYAKIADHYEMMADSARQYAIALREADTDKIIKVSEQITSVDDKSAVDRANRAADQLRAIESLDNEWFEEMYAAKKAAIINRMSPDQAGVALLLHIARCSKGDTCIVHKLLVKRMDEAK